MWHLTRLALRSRLLTIIVALMLAGGSIWALLGLKIELIPNIDFPYVTIMTIYPNATPDTVASEVTSPIEKAVWDRWGGSSLKHVTSTSSKGMSLVMAEFEFGTDMTGVTKDINSDISKLTFPTGVSDYARMVGNNTQNPQVIPINMNMMPLESISISGDYTPAQLKQIADTQMVPQLQGINGVLRVDTEGGEQDQVIISPNPDLMNKYGVSTSQIASLLNPAYSSLSEIGNTPLGTASIKLSDVAQITEGPPPISTITRTNGQPSVGISIIKTDTANTVEVANAVSAKLNALQGNLGNGVQLTTVFDQADFITSSINQLWEKAIVGGVLAIAVVFLFLWAVRASLITAISIPLSVLIGFLCMRLTGITINLLTLSAMSIAIGRLIDDSIVMVEVIFRRRQRGENFKDAALGGAKEVATPITTATLATVAIFLPLMFVGGIVGQLFIPFALTVTFAMIASLLVALMVVPALSKLLIAGKAKEKKVADNWYQRFYTRTLRWTLLHRATVIILAVVLFIGSIGLLPVVGTSFMAGMSDKSITVNVQMPPKTDIAVTSAVTAKVEAVLKGNKAIKNFYSSIGTGTSMAGIMSASNGGGGNTASITVYLNSDADLKKETDSINQACQGFAANGAITVSNSESGGGSTGFGGSNINISVQGQNQSDVARITNELTDRLKGLTGITNLANDLNVVEPKLNIAFDTAKIAASGLPVTQMAQLQQEFAYLMTGSTVPGKNIAVDSQNYSVFIKGVAPELTSVQQAQALKIGYPQSITLGDISTVTIQELPSRVSHTDTSLSATITAAVTEKNVGAVNMSIQKQINALSTHPGVNVTMGGVAEQMGDTLSRMLIAIVVAIIIVLLIVIIMMRSIRNPLLIMVSLPLASIGAIVALAISRYTLSVSAMMGMLMLVGIVLTNAIVLVTLVEHLRKNGMNTQEALLEGGKTRLRPILMTALTTIFAMVPMAVGLGGSGAMLTADLAIVVIGGLFSSTLLTLFVIPVIYSLAHKPRPVPAAK